MPSSSKGRARHGSRALRRRSSPPPSTPRRGGRGDPARAFTGSAPPFRASKSSASRVSPRRMVTRLPSAATSSARKPSKASNPGRSDRGGLERRALEGLVVLRIGLRRACQSTSGLLACVLRASRRRRRDRRVGEERNGLRSSYSSPMNKSGVPSEKSTHASATRWTSAGSRSPARGCRSGRGSARARQGRQLAAARAPARRSSRKSRRARGAHRSAGCGARGGGCRATSRRVPTRRAAEGLRGSSPRSRCRRRGLAAPSARAGRSCPRRRARRRGAVRRFGTRASTAPRSGSPIRARRASRNRALAPEGPGPRPSRGDGGERPAPADAVTDDRG